MPPLRIPKRVRFARFGCWCMIIWASLSLVAWSAFLLIPLVGLLAIPPVIASCTVLLYAIPWLAYLLLAQTDLPGNVEGIFVPFNPVRNLQLCLFAIRYFLMVFQSVPLFVMCTTRWILWEGFLQLFERAENPSRLSNENVGNQTHDGQRGDNKPQRERYIDTAMLIDSISRQALSPTIATTDDQSWTNLSPLFPGSQAQARPQGEPSAKPEESNPPTPTSDRIYNPTPTTIANLPIVDSTSIFVEPGGGLIGNIDSDRDDKGRPVMIFIFDVGMIGPVVPRKEMFCLLGFKLADLGYIAVIPDLQTYPYSNAEQTVIEIRIALNWTMKNIKEHGVSPDKIFMSGHGLGAHMAMFTLAQDAVIRSRDDCQRRLNERFLQYEWGSPPERPSRDYDIGIWGSGQRIPNGLKSLSIYGEDIEIPSIKGIILLAPMSDIIKQIRHESTLWIEHLSPVRRALGPSQTTCMQNSLGHLLFAAKNILQPDRLPPKVLIIHGAQDILVPLDSGHWLSELLYGLDINTAFRPYRALDHWNLVSSLMKGMETDYSPWLEKDFRDFMRSR